MKKPKTYEGELAAPIRPPRFTILGGETEEEWKLFLFDQWLRKMNLLMDQHGIARDDPQRFFALALRLAIEHVPGMRVGNAPRGRGRGQEWDPWRRAMLLESIKRAEDAGKDHAAALRSVEKAWGISSVRRRAEEAAKDAEALRFQKVFMSQIPDELLNKLCDARQS